MPDIRSVSDAFAVSGQLRPEEIAEVGARFAMVVNNRPDGEELGQPTHAELEAAARSAGVAYEHIPITAAPTSDQVRAMREALSYAEGPTLAFCRTGTRSVVTWALGEALAGRLTDELEAQGRAAGYDLGTPLASLLPRMTGGAPQG